MSFQKGNTKTVAILGSSYHPRTGEWMEEFGIGKVWSLRRAPAKLKLRPLRKGAAQLYCCLRSLKAAPVG